MNTKMNADSYFAIGADHLRSGLPCQDYADSRQGEDFAWAVVADGCSTSKYADIGARIMVQLTQQMLAEFCQQPQAQKAHSFNDTELKCIFKWRVLAELAGMHRTMGLSDREGLATLAFIVAKDDKAYAFFHGDGTLALKYKDGTIIRHHFEYEKNMPLYPLYHLTGMQEYIDIQGGITQTVLSEQIQNANQCTQKQYQLWEARNGVVIEIPQKENLEYAAVFSDGISSIPDMEDFDAVGRMMAFKNSRGEFAKRRMMREIKQGRQNGKAPLDDIAYAVIHFTEEEAQ